MRVDDDARENGAQPVDDALQSLDFGKQFLVGHQYSSGSRIVVPDRLASVMTQIFSSVGSMKAERIRPPWITALLFSRWSWASRNNALCPALAG
jgi:hypothetical protein